MTPPLARIEAVRGLLREAERADRAVAEDVDPVDQPVSVEVIGVEARTLSTISSEAILSPARATEQAA